MPSSYEYKSIPRDSVNDRPPVRIYESLPEFSSLPLRAMQLRTDGENQTLLLTINSDQNVLECSDGTEEKERRGQLKEWLECKLGTLRDRDGSGLNVDVLHDADVRIPGEFHRQGKDITLWIESNRMPPDIMIRVARLLATQNVKLDHVELQPLLAAEEEKHIIAREEPLIKSGVVAQQQFKFVHAPGRGDKPAIRAYSSFYPLPGNMNWSLGLITNRLGAQELHLTLVKKNWPPQESHYQEENDSLKARIDTLLDTNLRQMGVFKTQGKTPQIAYHYDKKNEARHWTISWGIENETPRILPRNLLSNVAAALGTAIRTPGGVPVDPVMDAAQMQEIISHEKLQPARLPDLNGYVGVPERNGWLEYVADLDEKLGQRGAEGR